MLSRFFRQWELQLARESGDCRTGIPFRVGGDWFVDEDPDLGDSDDVGAMIELGERLAADSGAFFAKAPGPIPYRLESGVIHFPSRGVTREACNRTVRMAYRPRREGGGPIVLALPAWNLARWGLRQLLPLARRTGFGGASLSLPYQDERMPGEWSHAEPLCCADLGLTLRAMQQGVFDAMDAISVLRDLGHSHIAVMGISIGSGIAALLDMHDPEPDAIMCVLCADRFADCVWNGITTASLRSRIEPHLDLDDLRRVWRPLEFRHHVDNLHGHPRLMRSMVTARFDFTFPHVNCRGLQMEYARREIDHDWTVLPCGHYSLGRSPFSLRFGLWLMRKLRTLEMAIAGTGATDLGPATDLPEEAELLEEMARDAANLEAAVEGGERDPLAGTGPRPETG